MNAAFPGSERRSRRVLKTAIFILNRLAGLVAIAALIGAASITVALIQVKVSARTHAVTAP